MTDLESIIWGFIARRTSCIQEPHDMATIRVSVFFLLIALSTAERMFPQKSFAKWKALKGLKRNAVLNAPPVCKKAIDLGITLEKRTKDDWGLEKNFIEALINKFPVNHDMTHIGVIGFDQRTELLFDFNKLLLSDKYKEDILKQLESWGPGNLNDTTRDKVIDRALEFAGEKLFTEAGGARGYDQVLVLLTDGKQINESFPLHDTPAAPVARRLELKGVQIIVVGIGFPDPVELMKIAGADSDNMEKFHNIFYLVNESVLQTEVGKVAKRICELSAPDIHSV